MSFQETFGVSESLLGLITPVGTVGFTVTLVIVGLSAGRIRMRRWFLGGVVGTAIAFVAIGLAPTYLLLLSFVGLRMAATGSYRALDRPILSHLYPHHRGRIFNLHTMAWAAGAAAGPVAVTGILRLTEWPVVYFILSGLLVPIVIAVFWLDVPENVSAERSITRGDLRRLAGRREILVMAVALIFVGGLESVFFTWLPYYATTFFGAEVGNLTLSVYLAAYVPGRYMFSRATGRWPYLRLVLAGAVCSAVMLPVVFHLAGQVLFFPAVFVVGVLISGLFPTLLAWGVDITPSFTGPINAAAMTAGQLGFFVFPAAVGVIADAASIQVAMYLQVALAVGLIATVLFGGRSIAASVPANA